MKQSQKRQLVNSIMGLRDASASKNDANGDYIDDDQRMKLFQKLTFPFSTL